MHSPPETVFQYLHVLYFILKRCSLLCSSLKLKTVVLSQHRSDKASNPGADTHLFPPFYKNRSDFSLINIFLIKRKLSRLKSCQYSVCMIQEPSKGDLWELKSKKVPGGACPWTSPFRSSFRKSVSIYPRSTPAISFLFKKQSLAGFWMFKMKRRNSSLVYGTSSLGEPLLTAIPKQLIQYFGCKTGLAVIAKQSDMFLELNHDTLTIWYHIGQHQGKPGSELKTACCLLTQTCKHILNQLPIAN